jgi:hypothetical protein
MTNSEITEQLKTLIRSKVNQAGGKVTLAFFDDIREQCLGILNQISPDTAEKGRQMLDDLYETARKEYISVSPIDIDPSSTLTKPGRKNWLTEERQKAIPTNYIGRYITHLRKSGRSEKVINEIARSSERILGNLGDPTADSRFYVKGLVVGSVQSGKTGNFNAVINRAIDAGYSLIIVLSGILEDLRAQTQIRIESDVIGEGVINVGQDPRGDKGVGKIRKFGETGDKSVAQIFSITSHKSDFVRPVKQSEYSMNKKNILIVKKNTGVLKNILLWLDGYLQGMGREKHSIPLLIIDDEADNASLNNLGHSGREYASQINGHIRALLDMFERKTYLGYTATPFANVLQDRNSEAEGKWRITYKEDGEKKNRDFSQVGNIFPDDFIELLNPPSNYIGARQIFQTALDPNAKKIPLVTAIDDCHREFPPSVIDESDGTTRPVTAEDIQAGTKVRSAKRSDDYPKSMPASLKEAVRCFILSIALRLSRKPEMIGSQLYMPHHTMLVHVSRFIPWQTRTKNLIASYVEELTYQIENDLPAAPDSIYGILKQTWNKHYADIVDNIGSYLPDDYGDAFLTRRKFNDILPYLIDSVRGIETKAINSETKDKLLYTEDAARNGKKYIAIGGNRLSRGFTLEGLTINYFIRDTNFSDTLLQMGRWFGYRPGYIDCCKLFTTEDSIEKFDLTTRTVEELEMELKKMERKNKSPMDFELRVRKHPGALKITRPSILKNTKEVNWSYQDKLEQTTAFQLHPENMAFAWSDLRTLFSKYRHILRTAPDFFTIHTDHEGLFEFLNIRNSFYDYAQDIENIKAFIRRCVQQGKLTDWVIAIKRKGVAGTLTPEQTSLPADIKMSMRSGPEKDYTEYRQKFIKKGIFYASGKSANIVTGGKDFSILLTDKQIEEAEKEFRNEQMNDYINKKKFTKEAAAVEVNKKTFPERIYRERIPDTTGLMIIYIMDTERVFLQSGSSKDEELGQLVTRQRFDLNVPIFGYAIGFPPISPDPGGQYVKGDYELTDDDDMDESDDLLTESDD